MGQLWTERAEEAVKNTGKAAQHQGGQQQTKGIRWGVHLKRRLQKLPVGRGSS